MDTVSIVFRASRSVTCQDAAEILKAVMRVLPECTPQKYLCRKGQHHFFKPFHPGCVDTIVRECRESGLDIKAVSHRAGAKCEIYIPLEMSSSGSPPALISLPVSYVEEHPELEERLWLLGLEICRITPPGIGYCHHRSHMTKLELIADSPLAETRYIPSTVAWASFWGPEVVERIGADRIESFSWERKVRLECGGYALMLSPHVLDYDEPEVARKRERAEEHLRLRELYKQLLRELGNVVARGIPRERYSFDGGTADGVMSIRRNGTKWELYYYEKGVKNVLGVYEREEDACQELWRWICAVPLLPDRMIASGEGLTRVALRMRLRARGVRDDEYFLDGTMRPDTFGLRWNGVRWEVYYLDEWWGRDVLGLFKKEQEACQFMYDKLTWSSSPRWYDRDDIRRATTLRLGFETPPRGSVACRLPRSSAVRIGIPREIKPDEGRVALTPDGVKKLTERGYEVLVETGAGHGSRLTAEDYRKWSGRVEWPEPAGAEFTDEEYERAGAMIVPGSREVYECADIIVKVAGPQGPECSLLRKGQTLFSFLDLISNRELTEALVERGVNATAYEALETEEGRFPVTTVMNQIAGAVAAYTGAYLLSRADVLLNGKGVLTDGMGVFPPATVVIIGGGAAGVSAARVALGMRARVTVLDPDPVRVRSLSETFGERVDSLVLTPSNLERALGNADVLIGAVEVPYGHPVPRFVTNEMVERMCGGSVMVDIAPERGSCIEMLNSKIQNPSDPTFLTDNGVIFYAVPNLCSAVPRTSSQALSNAILSYVLEVAEKGFERAMRENGALAEGTQITCGKITDRRVAEVHGLPWVPLEGRVVR